jgi:hypothetical protein
MQPPLPPEWDQWLQEGARLLAAPRLRRSEQITHGPHDPKFALGDMLVEVPLDYLEPLAAELGADKTQLRVYREVAAKIPPHSRVATSWTVHRDLRDAPQLLRSGLTVRKAAQLLGWYRSIDQAVRSKGTLYLALHPHGDHAWGRWVGMSYDGWSSAGGAPSPAPRNRPHQIVQDLIDEKPA